MYFGLKPMTDYHAWHVDRIALASLRIERIERMERRIRDKHALGAEATWEDDRKLQAEQVGSILSRRPAEAVEALRRTPQGCEWLMTRWALLAHAAEHNPGQAWTPAQVTLAFDLLATPAEFREHGKPGASIDFEGTVLESADDQAAVARRQVAELKERREAVAGLDESERHLTTVDLDFDSCAELRRLRRYESTLYRRVRWSVTEVNRSPYDRVLDPAFHPGWSEPLPIPSPGPEPKSAEEIAAEDHDPESPSPPFCLEPDEFPPPGQKADIPAVLAIRKQKRAKKAEARRESKRRKLDKLRA